MQLGCSQIKSLNFQSQRYSNKTAVNWRPCNTPQPFAVTSTHARSRLPCLATNHNSTEDLSTECRSLLMTLMAERFDRICWWITNSCPSIFKYCFCPQPHILHRKLQAISGMTHKKTKRSFLYAFILSIKHYIGNDLHLLSDFISVKTT